MHTLKVILIAQSVQDRVFLRIRNSEVSRPFKLAQ